MQSLNQQISIIKHRSQFYWQIHNYFLTTTKSHDLATLQTTGNACSKSTSGK